MKNLVKELIKENKNILHTYPNIKDNLRTSAGHRYMFNKEMISKLELLIIANVSQQRELLIAYEDYLNEYHTKEDRIKQVDKYLKANNCG